LSEVVIVSAVRTAIGNFGGAIKDVSATTLGSIVIKDAFKRIGTRPTAVDGIDSFAPSKFQGAGRIDLENKHYDWDESLKAVPVDEVIMGNVLQAGQGQNSARQAGIFAGVPKEVNAFTVNKICASGMKSIALAAQAIKAGDAEVIVAGGQESMSSTPYYMPKARWGARMFNAELVDGMVFDGLWETFNNYHMGITAENIAEKYGLTREAQDTLSVMSQERAVKALANGTFKDELVGVDVRVKKEIQTFLVDEHPRATSVEALGKLGAVFKKDGTVTAGNASGITDGAAAVILMSADKAKALGLKPLVKVKSYAAGGIDPAYMGLGVVPAVGRALKAAGLSLADMGAIEFNEAFASQTLGVLAELGLDSEDARINPHGSGISLGHPIGCTGARITVTLIYEMLRRGSQYGMAGLCIGGGQGMAIVLEKA
jgi:acetyl-CoA C-acetyltransferase